MKNEGFCIKMWDFVLKMRDFVLKMRDFAPKCKGPRSGVLTRPRILRVLLRWSEGLHRTSTTMRARNPTRVFYMKRKILR